MIFISEIQHALKNNDLGILNKELHIFIDMAVKLTLFRHNFFEIINGFLKNETHQILIFSLNRRSI